MTKYRTPPSSKASIALAKRIVKDAGVTGDPTERGLRSLINVCRGYAWGGNEDDWPEVLESVARSFADAMVEAGEEPDIRTLVLSRHRLTRAYAWGEPGGKPEVWA